MNTTPEETRHVQVVPAGGRGKWSVLVEGEKVSNHRRKDTAVQRGRKEAKRGGVPAELRIHKLNGQFQEERTYNKPDPYPPRG